MKKTLFLFFFVFTTIFANAQITVSLGGSSSHNGNYTSQGNQSFTMPNGTITDAGVYRYLKELTYAGGGGFLVNRYTVYRSNNLWYLYAYESLVSNTNTTVYVNRPVYVFTTFSNSIYPPCDEIWNSCDFNGLPTTSTQNIIITGLCTTPGTCNTAFTTFPSHIQIPTIYTQNLNAITPTNKGMLSYDCIENKLMLYDGNVWRMVQGSKNDIILSETAKIKFGNGYEIGQTTTNLSIAKDNNQFIGLTTDGFNKIGLNTATPTSSVALIGSNAHSVVTFSSNYTLSNINRYVFFIGTSQSNLTLPNPSTCSGRIYTIINHGTVSLQVVGYPIWVTELISIGTPNIPLITVNSKMELISDGTKWRVI
jgi:hypothetical protein